METAGHLWGYSTPRDAAVVHFIEHASISVFAERDDRSVADHPEELGVKRQLMSLLRPELKLMGDFHSHPYRSLNEARAVAGWEASHQDRQFWLHHADGLWLASGGCPVNMILTICPDSRAPGGQRPIAANTCEFGLGEFRFWLTAIVGEEAGGRRLSRNRSARVGLWPLPLENFAGPGESILAFDPAPPV